MNSRFFVSKYISKRFFLPVFVGLLVLLLGYFFLFCFDRHAQDLSRHGQVSGKMTLLAFGIDLTQGAQHSDTIMVVQLDFVAKRVGVLSIPRDTYLEVPGHGMTKLTHAYAYGGTPLLLRTVSGFLQMPIDHYIQVDLQGVSALVDALGGIDVNIPEAMNYEDHAGHLAIHFEKGRHRLNGEESVEFLRFRHNAEGDFGRMRRQQLFIKEAFRQIFYTSHVLDVPVLFWRLNRHFGTDLGFDKVVGVWMDFAELFRENRLDMQVLPASSYWLEGVSYVRVRDQDLEAARSCLLFGASVSSEQIGHW
ncbi:MAG: LytR family transcriptional regulator [Candidatus Margulisbacteria bacterium]|nr:LytR family transcriptional regulator [Candidatus Margulisiibacteriota bacterium]